MDFRRTDDSYWVQIIDRKRGGILLRGRRIRAADLNAAKGAARSALALSAGACVLRVRTAWRSGDIVETHVVATYGKVPADMARAEGAVLPL